MFGFKKILDEIRQLRTEQANLLHVVKVLAKRAGIILEIHEPGDGSATIAWVKEGDNIVNFESIRPSKQE